jgi:hypothetical protein
MESGIEKVTLSLNRTLLEKMAGKAQKSMSEYVRDLIQREKESIEIENDLIISNEILDLKGCLKPTGASTKDRVHEAAKHRLRK